VMLWWKDAPDTQTLGIVILILLLGGTGFGANRWVRYHRRANHDAALGPEPA
jgi:hypothetical protein